MSAPLRLFQARIVTPVLDLLRVGATPRKLAWSLAVGAAVGINPIVGSTTVACLAAALLLRLNVVASQLSNHLLFPAQLALVFVFIRLGEVLFHTGPLPLAREALTVSLRHHAWQTTRLLWTWEWHALLAWLACVTILTPLLATLLTPLLERLLHNLQHQPIVEEKL